MEKCQRTVDTTPSAKNVEILVILWYNKFEKWLREMRTVRKGENIWGSQ